MSEPEKRLPEGIDSWCQMCGAAPGEPCTVISARSADDECVREGYVEAAKKGDVRSDLHFYRGGLAKNPRWSGEVPAYPQTQFESLPAKLRNHVEALMAGWRDEGRDDERIEHVVHSVAVAAYGLNAEVLSEALRSNEELGELLAQHEGEVPTGLTERLDEALTSVLAERSSVVWRDQDAAWCAGRDAAIAVARGAVRAALRGQG